MHRNFRSLGLVLRLAHLVFRCRRPQWDTIPRWLTTESVGEGSVTSSRITGIRKRCSCRLFGANPRVAG